MGWNDPNGRPIWLRRASLAVLLLGYILLARAYRLATPFGEGPDEPGHVAYVSFLRANGRPPQHGEVREPLSRQVKHPPLYYALGAVATLGHDDRDLYFVPNRQFVPTFADPPTFTANHHSQDELPPLAPRYAFVAALRRLSTLLGLVTVLATFALARTVVPGAWWLAMGSAAVVAFLPQFLFMSGVANNDALASAVGALALVAAARVAVRPPRTRDLVVLGVLLGLGLLAKLTTLALLPVGGLAVTIAAWRTRSWRVLVRGAWCGAALTAVAGGWLAWNAATSGDVLGWAGFERAAESSARRTPLWSELPLYFRIQLESFVGRFGWMVVALPGRVYTAFGMLLGAAAGGLIVLGLRAWRRPDNGADVLSAPASRWAVVLLVAAVTSMYASVFRLALTFDLVVAQGRYLYPALSAFGVLFVVGLTGWLPPRWRAPAQGALAVSSFALGVFALTHVLQPAFGPVNGSLPMADLSATAATHVDAASAAAGPDFGPGLVRLVADPCVPIRRVRSGDTFVWPLAWMTSGRQPDAPLRMFARLVDADGRLYGDVERIPLGGRYPSSAWLPNGRFSEDVAFTAPSVDAPRRANVVVGWTVDGADGADRSDAADRSVGSRVPVVHDAPEAATCAGRHGGALPEGGGFAWPVVLVPATTVAVPQRAHPRGDTFGQPSSAVLRAFTVEPRPEGDGTSVLWLTLYWEAAAAVERDETVFVHLSGSDGWPGAGADGPPAGGTYPTSLWQAGDIVPDGHPVAWAERPVGTYRLTVGWYAPESGVRRPARDRDGRPWVEGAAVLGTVDVTEAGARFEPLP